MKVEENLASDKQRGYIELGKKEKTTKFLMMTLANKKFIIL
jgi:hypothetical protein